MTKKKKHNDIWKRLHFKYRLSAINENTLEEIWRIRASLFSGGVLVLIFALFLITVTSIFIIATPIKYYLPGYLDAEIRDEALKTAIQYDSLEKQMKYQEVYAENIRKILAGEIIIDSVNNIIPDTISISENDPSLKKSQTEEEYVKKYEEEEKYNLSRLPASIDIPTDGTIFYKPAKGLISKKFSPTFGQFGIDISVSDKETIAATLEGTIIYTGYDIKNGYTIQIQHKNGFISIYKHADSLLKTTGDQVKTGEAIAIIGNISNNTTDNGKPKEQILSFELWNKGNAVNPENYISF
jgi:murein DD-endopeptidase MepM/ murein hydrolase activator NlpD